MRRLNRIGELLGGSGPRPPASPRDRGRNLFSRFIDRMLAAMRAYAPPLHWLFVISSATILYIYARMLGLTLRIRVGGEWTWPEVPAPCVLAVWHGAVPSLIAAVAARPPRESLTIMIARDPRGDSLALLCRMLGLRVVRGDSIEGGWDALARMAEEIQRGESALITADGLGPARIVKVGVVALAAATGAPLVGVGAACTPAIAQKRKWDKARNPVPFGLVAITTGRPRPLPSSIDLEGIRVECERLEEELNVMAEASECLLGLPRS